MTSGRRLIVAAALVVGVLSTGGAFPSRRAKGGAPAQVRMAAGRAVPTALDSGNKPPPLVNSDDELAGFLAQAEELVERKAYDRAIDIIQALIDRPDSGFVPATDGRQYVSLWLKAMELIGRMGPEGLKRYRRRFGPAAQRLHEQAVARCDEPALRRVAQRYLWTEYGVRSLEALAHLAFDSGRFARAGALWRQALRIRRGGEAQALLLTKAAVAFHLAGDDEAARKFGARLEKEHPKAEAVVAGRKQNLVQFVRRAGKLSTPERVRPQREVSGWPGLGGFPDGLTVMTHSEVVLMPRWRVPPNASEGSGEVNLLVGGGLLRRFPNYTLSPKWKNGHIHVTLRRRSGSATRTYGSSYLPPLLDPVVVGDLVICRQDDVVQAYDLLTGKKTWTSAGKLRLESQASQRGYVHFSSSMGVPFLESGHYGLTVGGGRIYTLYDYAPPQMYRQHPFVGRVRTPAEPMKTSCMAALSLRRQGALVWTIGAGEGGDEVIRNGRFLTAPTYRAGRLYVVSLYLESYYLVCLDAETGEPIWSSMIAQTPAVPRRYGWPVEHWFLRGSGPAIADGMVFGLTNSGAVGAFEAETGRPVWAYQYDSTVNTPHSPVYRSVSYRNAGMRGSLPPNPVIVAQGKVICLPVDSARVFALSTEDGRRLWAAERGQQQYLTALDEDRVLLSGNGFVVLSVETGEELYAKDDPDILARPAVTEEAVLASTEAGVLRISLDSYETKTTARDARGILGNLVSVDGKLIAANAGGLCAYFNFDYARRALTERIVKARGDKRWELLFQRGQIAFNARRFDLALEDFQACWTAAETSRPNRLKLKPWRMRTYVALGNRADKPEKMLELFRKAQECTSTERDRAHMKVRLAKYYEKVGQYERAVATANEIAQEFGRLEIADVGIGPGTDDTARLDARAEQYPAEEWSVGKNGRGGFVGRLIAKYGQKVYAALDAEAKKAFTAARAAFDCDALVEVARTWPHSKWADDARFTAAEIWYKKAIAIKSPREADLLLQRKVIPQLEEVVVRRSSPLRVSAAAALATIYARGGRMLTARQELDPVRDQPADSRVSFADIQGTLGRLIQEIEGGELPRFDVPMRFVSRLEPPLSDKFRLEGDDVLILRDQDYRPVRLGERLLVLRGKRAILLNTAAAEAPKEYNWASVVSIDLSTIQRYLYSPGQALVCGLSADRKVLAIADRQAVRGFDVKTGKVKWRERTLAELGIGSLAFMGTGGGALVLVDTQGKLTCVDIAGGELKWKATLVGGNLRLPGNRRTNARPTAAPVFAAGCVYVRHGGNRAVTCLDLRTGKVLGKWGAKSHLQAFPTAEGMLVMMADGELSVREIIRNDEGRRTFSEPRIHRYGESSGALILGICRDRIALSPNRSSSEVRVLPMVRNQAYASFEAAGILGKKAMPVEAYFDGDDLFVLSTTGRFGTPRSTYGRLTSVRGLSLERYDLAEKKRVWQKVVEPPQRYTSYLMPLVMGQDHVVVAAKSFSSGMPSQAKILDRAEGKMVGRIDLRAGGGTARLRAIGPPVMTNGRLCVEDSKGLTVYGGR